MITIPGMKATIIYPTDTSVIEKTTALFTRSDAMVHPPENGGGHSKLESKIGQMIDEGSEPWVLILMAVVNNANPR